MRGDQTVVRVQQTGALAQAAEQLGPIEVLQYSPLPAKEFMRPVLETVAADLVGPTEFSTYGPVIAAHQVIPGMRSLGRGTLFFINGASAARPGATVTGTSIAFAGESASPQLLHDALAPEGIHGAQLIIPQGIGGGEASHEPAVLAETLWKIHTDRSEFRTDAAPLPEGPCPKKGLALPVTIRFTELSRVDATR